LRLGTRVIQSARESILITDANANLIDVNPMVSELTGYSRDEVVGKNPRFLGSGRHDGAFFEEMWNELGASGTWQGEIWNKTKHGDVFACRINISTLKDELTGETLNYVGMFSDVTEIRQQQERMEHLAHHDPLTDLPNRLEFMDRLSQEVSRTVRYDRMMAVAYIDLDGFKPVNDDYGHLVGDLALKEVAERLRFAVRKEDVVARLGGDEFAVIFSDLKSKNHIDRLVSRIIFDLAQAYEDLNGFTVQMSASVGVAICPDDAVDADSLLKMADDAMYEVKRGDQLGVGYAGMINSKYKMSDQTPQE